MLPAAREPWWRTPATRTAISLTSQPAERLDAIYRESRPIRRRLRRQLTTQQKLVAKMVSAGPLDDEHVRPVVDRLIAIDPGVYRRVAADGQSDVPHSHAQSTGEP